MTHKERAICALTGGTPDYVPTMELVFHLTQEVFGQDWYWPAQLEAATGAERERMLRHNAALYVTVAQRFDYSIIMINKAAGPPDIAALVKYIRDLAGDQYLLMAHGDATYSIPSGDQMTEFVYWLYDHPEEAHAEAASRVDEALERGKYLLDQGLDGFILCADYCVNQGPFLPPAKFSQFVTPYLHRLVSAYKDMGAWVIKHTDGNIMPIIEDLVSCEPHALHSLDPMAGVDIGEVKARYGDRLCLIGNVDCSLLQTGTREQMIRSAEYALEKGKPGGGYIFGTSNCVFAGMPVESYLLIHDIWRRHRAY
ncbi:MAG: hypothetical protein HPY83_03430 [Anaerolineae bacterium]|nr:hypothetical protein [Anaerolineae bacterium]